MIDIRRAAARTESVQPGISTWHCFSAGQHYDPDNVAFGALIGLDEHELAPDAGFAPHRHRGVAIVSWVLAGALRHEQHGDAVTVRPGHALVQLAGDGINHVERNPSPDQRLRFVQCTLRDDGVEASTALLTPPFALAGGTFAVVSRGPVRLAASGTYLFVARGDFEACGVRLTAGDSARLVDEPGELVGSGELLMWNLEAR